MAKTNYGFFAKWKDFFVHPTYLFESLLLEPVERTATIIVPQLIILFAIHYFAYALQIAAGSKLGIPGVNIYPVSFVLFLGIAAMYFVFIHGFMRLLGGSGSMADTFTAYGYGVLFINYMNVLLMILALVCGVIYNLLAIIPFFLLVIFNIWSLVSFIIGLSVTHNVSALRTIFALILTGFVGMLVYLITSDLLLQILHSF